MEEGAHVVDVNVGVSGIDEARMLKEAVMAIQAVTDVPLCIDSALPGALEAALKVYQGKAIVNSVNGEKQKLDLVLPLVKAYGAAVIGLTMDDRGIPKRAEDRLAIARKIVETAESKGIPRQDVIIDPLAMAVSADDQAALETIRALQLIRDELGVNQTLGLSNISFGLPERSDINAAFMAMAVLSGVTCPIVDPTQWEIRRASLIANMLLGKDEFCMGYLSAVSSKSGSAKTMGPADKAGQLPGQPLDALKEAVIHGKRKIAIELTQKALDQGNDPAQLIDRTLIPALNTVGDRFERREIFVPERFLEAAREHRADVVGLSSLLTTGDPHVEETVKAIRQSDMSGKVNVICGGAALTARFVEETCGADAYAKDAAEGVKKIEQILETRGQ